MPRTFGIMGGTFNPIHLGHLLAAQEAMEKLRLDEILFVPNRIPPHRRQEKGILHGEVRFVMINLAIADNPRFQVSRIELDRPEISYTVHTVEQLVKERPGDEISFITGVDSLLKDPWHRMDDLLEILTRFIAVTRPGFDEGKLFQRLKELGLKNAHKVTLVGIPQVGVSSTMIRKRIKNGRSIRYLVPEPVESFIRKNNLYI